MARPKKNCTRVATRAHRQGFVTGQNFPTRARAHGNPYHQPMIFPEDSKGSKLERELGQLSAP